MSDWTAIIDDVIDHVSLLKELGERTVEIDPTVLRVFAAAAVPASVPRGGAAVQPASSGPAARTEAALPAFSLSAAGAAAPAPSDASSVLSPEARRSALADIAKRADLCDACPLRQNRTKSVPGQGNPNSPDVMFIGEAPGYDEDQQGLAFVGAAGQLLTKMITAMGYTRDDIFIANICKCRPPGNRTPLPEEMLKCLPFLREQIRIIRPKVIATLGRHSMGYVMRRYDLDLDLEPISKIHGKSFETVFIDENNDPQPVTIVTLYHPASALYNGGMRDTHKQDFEILKNY